MYCNNCGAQNAQESRFCSECGTPQGEGNPQGTTDSTAQASDPAGTSIGTRDEFRRPDLVYPRNPPLSPHLCWVNIFLVGLAQIIHQQIAKGFTIIGTTIVVGLIYPPAALLLAIISILDAFLVGWALKKGKPVGKWRFFPL